MHGPRQTLVFCRVPLVAVLVPLGCTFVSYYSPSALLALGQGYYFSVCSTSGGDSHTFGPVECNGGSKKLDQSISMHQNACSPLWTLLFLSAQCNSHCQNPVWHVSLTCMKSLCCCSSFGRDAGLEPTKISAVFGIGQEILKKCEGEANLRLDRPAHFLTLH